MKSPKIGYFSRLAPLWEAKGCTTAEKEESLMICPATILKVTNTQTNLDTVLSPAFFL